MRYLYNSLADFLEKKFRFDARYFIKGGFWLTTTQGFVVLSGLVTTALFAHFLSPEQYGIYKYLIGLAAIFATFSLTGLGQSIFQTAAKKYLGFYRETFKLNALYNIGVIASAALGGTYYLINENLTLGVGCFLIAFLQPLINQFQYIPAVLNGTKRFKEATLQQIFRTLFVTTASLIALFFTANILILFATYLTAQAIGSFISERYHRPQDPTPTPPDIFQKYISYAKHTSVRNTIGILAQRLDTVIVFTQLGAAELATYAIAMVIPEQIKGSLKSLSTLLLSKYASTTHHQIHTSGLLKRSLQLIVLLIFITASYFFLSPYVYEIIFPQYPSAISLTQLYSLVFVTYVVYLPYSLLSVQLAEKQLYLLNIGGSIFQTILFILIIPTMGIVGAILVKLIYRFSFTILTFIVYYLNSSK